MLCYVRRRESEVVDAGGLCKEVSQYLQLSVCVGTHVTGKTARNSDGCFHLWVVELNAGLCMLCIGL